MSVVHIDIIVNYNGVGTNIKMRNDTKMYKVFCACCDRLGLNPENYVLCKKGVQVDEQKDATFNAMENGDVLDIENYSSAKHKNYA